MAILLAEVFDSANRSRLFSLKGTLQWNVRDLQMLQRQGREGGSGWFNLDCEDFGTRDGGACVGELGNQKKKALTDYLMHRFEATAQHI